MSPQRILTKEERCVKKVFEPGGWFHTHQCYNKGIVKEVDGLKCRIHSEEATKRRRKKSHEAYEAQHRRRMAPYDTIKELKQALDAHHGAEVAVTYTCPICDMELK